MSEMERFVSVIKCINLNQSETGGNGSLNTSVEWSIANAHTAPFRDVKYAFASEWNIAAA